MLIVNKTDAFKELEKFASENWDYVGGLVKYIIDNNLQCKFDEVISCYFRNGVSYNEFEDYCCNYADEIIEKMKL